MKKQNLQIFRIMACIGVFAVHVGQNYDIGKLKKYTDYGAYGVHIFFIISAIVAFLQFERKNYVFSTGGYVDYIKRRMLRILPIFYTIIICYMLYYNIQGTVPKDNTGLYWWRYFLLIYQIVPSENVFWTNIGGVWSISAFIIFYLISPILWKYMNSYRKSILGLLGFLIVAECLFRCGVGVTNIILYQEFFLLGIVVYFSLKEKNENKFIFIMCLSILLVGLKRDFLPVALNYRDAEVVIFSIVCSIMIVVTWRLEIKHKWLDKIISVFDRYTYAIYLCHPLVIVLIKEYFNQDNVILCLISVILGTIIVSIGVDTATGIILNKMMCLQKKINRWFIF